MASKMSSVQPSIPSTLKHIAYYCITVLAIITIAKTDTTNAQVCPSRCRSCQNRVANCKSRSLTAPPKSYPPDTQVIDLQNNHIRILGSRTFRQQQTAEVLRIGNNKITQLRNDAFRSFPNLISLDLNGNRITRAYPRALNGLSRLQTLSLNRNRIRRLSGMFSRGAPNIQQLNLASNRIASINQNDLAALTRLRNLDLRDNSISHIHERAFIELTSLRYLFLNNNPLATALNLDFSSTVLQLVDISNCEMTAVPQTLPASVAELRLGGNKIMQVQHTDFQNVTSLVMLALNDNELHFLGDGSFTQLTNLKEIWLRGNNLVYVPRGIPPNVKRLYMDTNRIQEIEPGLFSADSDLEFFSCENNNIRRINPDTFTGMTNLATINGQGNQLQILEARTFSDMEALQTLLLSNNPLGRIELGAFRNLSNLTNLHLSYLSLETMELDDNFLSQMPGLQTLHMMASPGLAQAFVDMVEGLNEQDFVIMTSLTTLDLSYNNLQWLNPRIRVIFPNVRSVFLDGNPFHCTENLGWLHDWMQAGDITFHQYEELKCETPASLRGRTVQGLTRQELREGGTPGGNRNQNELVRQRSKRRHDEATYRESQTNAKPDARDTIRGQSQRPSAQADRRQNQRASVDEKGQNQRTSVDERRQNQRTSVQPINISERTQEVAMTPLEQRAQREERRKKMRRSRSKSRSRKGGKRRGKGRRRRKGRKNKNKGGKKRGSRGEKKRRNRDSKSVTGSS